jgi:hypothetical protein
MSNDKTNMPNPWGNYGKAIKPRTLKHNAAKKSVSILTLQYAAQDQQDWVNRCMAFKTKIDAIKKHVEADPSVRFIKREFILAGIEKCVDEYIKDNNITL